MCICRIIEGGVIHTERETVSSISLILHSPPTVTCTGTSCSNQTQYTQECDGVTPRNMDTFYVLSTTYMQSIHVLTKLLAILALSDS